MAVVASTRFDPQLERESPLVADPVEEAKAAGLRYFTDVTPGIRRKRAGRSFTYISPDGEKITAASELERIRALAIPPAWTDVWICPSPRGHLQATGRDARGRKQYRYHERWREIRDETKYSRMLKFGEALPLMRERTSLDLAQHCLSRDKVLATVVQLLDATAMRVGNEEYARENKSFGLTTLRTKHVDVDGATLRFRFRGKSGKEQVVDIHDRRLARAVKRCEEIPGYELFQYLDDAGERHSIDSADVNDYLRHISGDNFTAKDFRTWHGTVVAAESLFDQGPYETETEAKRKIKTAIERAAEHLRNTPAICRKSYVHPAVGDAYLDGWLAPVWEAALEKAVNEPHEGLRAEEVAALAVLQEQLAREADKQKAS